MSKTYYVYILASKPHGTLYIGITSNLIKRVWQHKEGVTPGFTTKYTIKNLVYYEQHFSAETAIRREKQLKTWKRLWKIRLIKSFNPG